MAKNKLLNRGKQSVFSGIETPSKLISLIEVNRFFFVLQVKKRFFLTFFEKYRNVYFQKRGKNENGKRKTF